MPTGYTAIIETGATFEEFVWRCARGMGALILMRDDPLDAPIPVFQPAKYYHETINATLERVRQLESMSAAQRTIEGERLKQEAVSRYEKMLQERIETNQRYDDMRGRVEAWEPPTPDHQGLKDLMLQQISVSIQDSNWIEGRLEMARAKTAGEFFADALSEARKRLAYTKEEFKKEVERTEGRNRWVTELKRSVPYPPTGKKRDTETQAQA